MAYHNADGIQVFHGDAREILPDVLPDEPQVWLMDPPYSSGGFQEAGRAGGSLSWAVDTSLANDQLSTRGYMNLLREVLRYSHNAGDIGIFTDWRMWVNTSDALEYAGITVRSMLVWVKDYGGPGRPWFNQHELIAFGMRGRCPKTRDAKHSNVLTHSRLGTGATRNHPTEKPLPLVRQILENMGPGVVVDPFMGSGTTLRAAKDLGRRAIGIELDEAHCVRAVERLGQMTLEIA